ncbi:MAG: tetratricopeptide repeat protein, partial [Planctomycetaceae bacterium]|nr:tetratricopeptide repeat protein [Planctomycetaceae bacterium]
MTTTIKSENKETMSSPRITTRKFMRKSICILFYVLLSVTAFSEMTGCKTTSSDSSRWLTPNVRGQAPAAAPAPDAFSSPQVVAVPELPIPVTTTAPPPTMFAPPTANDPFLAASQMESTDPVMTMAVPAMTAPAMTVHSAPPALPVAAPVVPNDPWMPKVAAASQPIPPYRNSPESVHATPIPTTAAVPLPQTNDPWGLDNTEIQNAVSIEEQAKREEEEIEKARLAELATAQRKNGTPEYLQPLPKWNGPFETREKKQTIEQDIIRQVGYSEEKPKGFDNLPVYDWEKEEQKGFDWSVLDPVHFFTKVRDWVGLGPDEAKANAAMKKGRELLLATPDLKDRKKCLEAAKQFSEAAKRWSDSLLEEDALHLAGECYFFADDYPKAMKSYQKLLIKYQHSKYVDNGVRRLFKIAQYWEEEDRRGVSTINMTEKSRPAFDTFGYAKKAYETIFINDPNGPVSDDAVMALATAYLRKGRYQGDDHFNHAAYYYNYLRENYPLSDHITKAHEYELEARTHAYMGAEHSSATLDEAQKLAEITLRQFGSELDEKEKEDMVEIKEGIIQRQAEREWTMGQFYDKKQYYGSARLY